MLYFQISPELIDMFCHNLTNSVGILYTSYTRICATLYGSNNFLLPNTVIPNISLTWVDKLNKVFFL